MSTLQFDDFKLTFVNISQEKGEFVAGWEESIRNEDIGEYTLIKSQSGFNFLNTNIFSLMQEFFPHALAMNRQDENESGQVTGIKIQDYEDPIVNISYLARFSAEKPEKHSTGKVLLAGGFYKKAEEVKAFLIDLKINLFEHLIMNKNFFPESLSVNSEGIIELDV